MKTQTQTTQQEEVVIDVRKESRPIYLRNDHSTIDVLEDCTFMHVHHATSIKQNIRTLDTGEKYKVIDIRQANGHWIHIGIFNEDSLKGGTN